MNSSLITFLLVLLLECTCLPLWTLGHRQHPGNFGPFHVQRFVHRFVPFHRSDPPKSSTASSLLGDRHTSAERLSSTSTTSTPPNNNNNHYPYLTAVSTESPLAVVERFVEQEWGYRSGQDYIVKDQYTDAHNGVTHVYLKQKVHGLEVTNADLNVNVDRLGRIISYGDSFFQGQRPMQGGGDSTSGSDGDDPWWQRAANRVLRWGSRMFQGGDQLVFGSLPSEQDDTHESSPSDSQASQASQGSQGGFAKTSMSLVQAVLHLATYLQLPHPPRESIRTQPHDQESESGSGRPSLVSLVLGFPFARGAGIRVTQSYLQTPLTPNLPETLAFQEEDSTNDNTKEQMQLRRVWDIQLEMDENWYHAHVDAHTGQVLSLMDWVADASYEVFPVGVNDPSDGERSVVVDPHDKVASPLGWHAESKDKQFTDTQGNNVIAQENLAGTEDNDPKDNYRPDGTPSLQFQFPMDLQQQQPKEYLDAAVTNLFYWNNVMHDLFYRFGFDEKAGNFQQNNFGRGGRGGDGVIANAQDGAGFNNANFATPPDGMNQEHVYLLEHVFLVVGQPGKMRMYVWDQSTPHRDGDLENGIIIHEYGHGISTRLTGGPANSNCLGWGESGGMGEGWGDFWSLVLRMRPEHTRKTDFAMGVYAMGGNKAGIRKYVYSTNMETNPSTYGFIKKLAYIGVHAKGEVWAAILYEMYWNLVDQHGFTANLYNATASYTHPQQQGASSAPSSAGPPKNSRGELKWGGNVIALQLTVDGLKFQPCRPSFVDARDAILQADEVNYGGENSCLLWKAFAKRGLGVGAKKGGREDFGLPQECS